MKFCSKCETEKNKEEFNKKASRPDGLYNFCRPCQKLENKKSYDNNKEKRIKQVKIYYENNKQTILENKRKDPKTKEYNKKWTENNKEYNIQRNKEWRKNNEEYRFEYSKNYRKNNKQKMYDCYKAWMQNNPLAKIGKSCRGRLVSALKEKGYTKHKKTLDALGCSLQEAKEHIEKQFQEGMSWENHGEWHIDHIVALATANTEEEVYKLCHYTNLQPLWAIDNIRKSKY